VLIKFIRYFYALYIAKRYFRSSIGIVGLGVVGSAVYEGFKKRGVNCIYTYDIKGISTEKTLESLVVKSNYIFICVPTPTKNSVQDDSIVESICLKIDSMVSLPKTVIIKSTVLPSVVQKISQKVNNITLVTSPEFLTQRTALQDFLYPTRIIWGTSKAIVNKDLYRLGSMFYTKDGKSIPQFFLTCEDAMKCKYMANCFGAIKIVYFNMMHKWIGSDYNKAKDTMLLSGWLNPMYTNVPGHDGLLGFGGACLPKDLKALENEFYCLNESWALFLRSVCEINSEIRKAN